MLYLARKAWIATIMKICHISISFANEFKTGRRWRQVNAHLYAFSRFNSHRVSFEEFFYHPFATRRGLDAPTPASYFINCIESIYILLREVASSLYMLLIIRVISLAQAVLSRRYTTSFTTVLFWRIWRCRKLQRLKTHSAIRHLTTIIIPSGGSANDAT